MHLPLIECSPEARKRMKPDAVDNVGTSVSPRETLPYSQLPIGFSFTLPVAEIKNEHSFRNMVMAKAKTLKKKFTVVKHDEPLNCFEVARIE